MARRRRQVIWTHQGQTTLDEIISYIAEDSPRAAKALLERALRAASSLSHMSSRGRIVPELQLPAIREVFIQRYRMIYEVKEATIEILAFIHGARDFAAWHKHSNEHS